MTQATLVPPPIRSKLSSARNRLRLVDYALCGARVVLAVATAAVTVLMLDYLLEPPLVVIRSFALFMTMVAAAVSTVFVSRVVRRSLTDDDVALLVEREFPELKDGLVSAVQLAREADRDDAFTSPSLIRSTIERTASQIQPLDFGRVVRTGPLVPLWLLIGSLAGLFALGLSQKGPRAYAWLCVQRVVLGRDLAYPKLIAIEVGTNVIAGVRWSAAADGRGIVEESDLEELQPGDVVVALNGTGVDTYDTFTANLAALDPGSPAQLEVLRGSERLSVTRPVEVQIPEAVAKGDNLRIDIRIRGRETERLVLKTLFADETEEHRELSALAPNRFRKSYENVTQPFQFYVRSDEFDVQTPVYTVNVVQRPRIELYDFALSYPAYTGKRDETLAQPNLRVPVGTSLRYLVVANKALDQARLVFEYEELVEDPESKRTRRQVTRETGPPPVRLDALSAEEREGAYAPIVAAAAERGVDGDDYAGRVWVGDFRVNRSTKFRFTLRSEEGYRSGAKPVVFSVQAVLDRAPIVSIPVPGRRKQVTPTAKVPLKITARDDYGIAALELRLQPEIPDKSAPAEQRVELTGFEVGAEDVEQDYELNLADLRLRPGESLKYKAVAFDDNVIPEERASESRVYELVVVKREDLERILQDRLTGLKERLESAERDQQAAKELAESFVSDMGPKNVFGDEDKRRLQELNYAQKRVTQSLGEVQKQLEEIAQERELNRLEDEDAKQLNRDLQKGIEDATKESRLIAQQAAEARESQPPIDDRLRNEMARVPDRQQAIQDALKNLSTRIDKWGDFTEVIQSWRDLRVQQDKIIEGTREAAKEDR
ncbi:MAG: PDZ domain-containing protein [Planctomycetota bacterium]